MKKKPCPFCGGKRLLVSKSDCSWHEPAFAYSVGCAGADCHGHIFALGHDLFKTEKEAVEAWNERAEDDKIEKLREENAKLKEALQLYSDAVHYVADVEMRKA
jgi:Lar family restriction alleviation protein